MSAVDFCECGDVTMGQVEYRVEARLPVDVPVLSIRTPVHTWVLLNPACDAFEIAASLTRLSDRIGTEMAAEALERQQRRVAEALRFPR